jgi:hypothetical protein
MDNTNPNPESSTSQCAEILRYLQAGNRLTVLSATTIIGTTCLPKRISDVEKMGHKINRKWKYYNKKWFYEYFIGKDEPDDEKPKKVYKVIQERIF